MIRETDLHPERTVGPSHMPAVMDAAMFAIENAPSVLVARVKCGKCGKSAGELIARGKAITLDSATAQDLRWGSPPTCRCPIVSCDPSKLTAALGQAKWKASPVTFKLSEGHYHNLTPDELALLREREQGARWREGARGRARISGDDLRESDLDIIEALRSQGVPDPAAAYKRLPARRGIELLRKRRDPRHP